MRSIVDTQYCCGCGACSNACPQNAIDMTQDNIGFFYPKIDEIRCIDCGICSNVCPIVNNAKRGERFDDVYTGYFENRERLLTCASGGAASAISEKVIRHKGIVFGTIYAKDYKAAETTYTFDIDGLKKFSGSKYIQSRKGETYKKIQEMLKAGNKVLYNGLPCEIGAAKCFLGNEYDNFYTIELICQGPTSEFIAKAYVEHLEERYKSKIINFSVRYKKDGWTPPYLLAIFKNGRQYIAPLKSTEFGFAFNVFSRPSCFNCVYKAEASVADITIGDAWGLSEKDSGWNKNGVSLIIVHSLKGKYLIDDLHDFQLIPAGSKVLFESNPYLFKAKTGLEISELFGQRFTAEGLFKACRKSMSMRSYIRCKIECLIHHRMFQ